MEMAKLLLRMARPMKEALNKVCYVLKKGNLYLMIKNSMKATSSTANTMDGERSKLTKRKEAMRASSLMESIVFEVFTTLIKVITTRENFRMENQMD